MKATKRAWFLLPAGAALAIALGQPVRTLAVHYWFSAHMLQHILLQLVAPPLALLALAPPENHRDVAENLSPKAAVAMWLAGVGAMWIWHAPFLCNAVIESPVLRWFQFATLLLMGAMFWWPIAGPRRQWRLPPPIGILYLFTACLGCTALGIVVTFAPPDLYGRYFHAAAAPGIFHDWITTPAADQRLGGLLMWVPACFIYITGILGLLNRWYAEPETGVIPAAASQPGF